MNIIRKSLGAKLFLSYIAVVLIGGLILFSATRLVMPGAYNRHMIGIQGAGGGMGPGQGQGMMGNMYQNFRSSFYEALTYAAFAAIIAAVAVSAFISRRIVAPLKEIMSASQHISEGHYEERVQVKGGDELGQLAERFNLMTVELEQTENRRRQLIGDVSHELRTPLTAIIGSMEGLVDGVIPAKSEVFLQIQSEADRLSRLVDDLQELSRVESHAFKLQLRPIAISELVATTFKRLNPGIVKNQIELIVDLSDDLPLVLADEDRMVQVLMNLVGNALNYSPVGGQIQVTGFQEAGFVLVEIKDTGIGISRDKLPRIFDRFYRVDKSRSRANGGGSGIGLTVTKSLIEAQGGRLWAESEGLGYGSTFIFTLPIA